MDDTATYIDCMKKVRDRVNIVQTIHAGGINTGIDFLNAELVCVQFRKALELIAFASLTANREKYAQAYADFERDGRAKRILEKIEKLNPDFYPVPFGEPIPDSSHPNKFTFPPPADNDALTRREFELLFDTTSEILHMRSPFSTKPPTDIVYPVERWVLKIQKLLAVHMVHLVDSPMRWVVRIPKVGDVQLYPAAPI
jgi:hypothetical protein